jgi:hypothetical protein
MMLRFVSNLFAALLTFSIGLAANSLRPASDVTLAEGQGAAETPITSLCDLKANPHFYRNKSVRMRATLVDYGLMQSAYFYDASCRDTNNYVENLPVTRSNREVVKATIDTLVAVAPSPRRVNVVVSGHLGCWNERDGCVSGIFTIERVEQAVAVAATDAWPWDHPTCSQ